MYTVLSIIIINEYGISRVLRYNKYHEITVFTMILKRLWSGYCQGRYKKITMCIIITIYLMHEFQRTMKFITVNREQR